MPNFKEEVISLGLQLYVPDDLITRTETLENPDWGGPQTANQLGFLGVDGVTRQAVVNENSMLIAKIEKKIRPQEPPFEEIRDEVADLWIAARSKEIAQETLRSIYDQFASSDEEDPEDPEAAPSIDQPVVVDAAAFEAAIREAGLEIIERPYLARGKSPSDDPAEETDLDRHLRSQPILYSMEEGAVAPPAQSFTKEATYLVRLADQRDPDPSGIQARDLLTLRQTIRGETAQAFREEAFNPKSEAFRSKFKVWLKYWDDPDEVDPDADAPESDPGA